MISLLAEGKKGQHIPFRDSKLTHILKESLTGNSRTTMLATIHGSVLWFDETLSTLRYASSVKRIKTSAVMNAEAAAHDIIAELRGEVVKLSAQLLSFQQKNSDMSQRRTPPRRKSSRAQKNRRATRTTSLGSGEAPELDDDGHALKRPSWLVRTCPDGLDLRPAPPETSSTSHTPLSHRPAALSPCCTAAAPPLCTAVAAWCTESRCAG